VRLWLAFTPAGAVERIRVDGEPWAVLSSTETQVQQVDGVDCTVVELEAAQPPPRPPSDTQPG
jgi:hypothetical protein